VIATEPTATTKPLTRRGRKAKRALAPRANFGVRWVFPAALIGLAVATVLLGLNAKDLVLNSRDGNIAHAPTDPKAPGFAAEVVPTPTLLMLQTTDKNELVSVAIMSLASNEAGGTMLFFPSDLIVKLSTGDSATLAKIYADAGDQGNKGELALRAVLTRMIDADIDNSIVLGAKALEALIQPVAPLQYALRDSVRNAQNAVVLRTGAVSISSADQVLAATELLSPGEASVNRTARQITFWQAWFDALRKVPDKSALFPPLDPEPPLVRFAKSFGTGTAALEQAPFTETTYKGLTLLVADTVGITKIAQRMIPYPVGYEPGARLLVEVRNGTGDLTRNEPMNRKVVLAGGQVVVLGNTEAFGVATSSVVFYDEELRARVTAFAKAAGLPDPMLVDRPGSSIEVTVTIGADFTS
jgi:hypothetical protein